MHGNIGGCAMYTRQCCISCHSQSSLKTSVVPPAPQISKSKTRGFLWLTLSAQAGCNCCRHYARQHAMTLRMHHETNLAARAGISTRSTISILWWPVRFARELAPFLACEDRAHQADWCGGQFEVNGAESKTEALIGRHLDVHIGTLSQEPILIWIKNQVQALEPRQKESTGPQFWSNTDYLYIPLTGLTVRTSKTSERISESWR